MRASQQPWAILRRLDRVLPDRYLFRKSTAVLSAVDLGVFTALPTVRSTAGR
jgi:hypothetical protein